MVDYLGFVFQGFFMGVGTATGLWFYESWLKPKIDKARKSAHKLVRL